MQSSARTDVSGSFPQGEASTVSSAEPLPAFKLIHSQLQKVKKLINEQLSTSAKTGVVNQLLEYINTSSGKMIRPGLVLLAGSAVNKITEEHIRIAAIFEMIHNATLLHDDVIDDGQRRRGQPTINSLWGNESAVLLGDFLLSWVFKMCTKLEPHVAKEIAVTTARVCEGELRQVSESRNWLGYGKLRLDEHLSETQYLDIITEKSASLFSSCCYLGGLLSKGTKTQLQSLRCFGTNAGIAFQITDDLLDIIGDERKTGKTLGSDAGKNKLTLVLIHLLKVADENERNSVINLLCAGCDAHRDKKNTQYAILPSSGAKGRNTQYDKDVLAEMLKSYGSFEYARSRAQEFVAKAIAALADLKDSDAKDALIETAKFMANRIA